MTLLTWTREHTPLQNKILYDIYFPLVIFLYIYVARWLSLSISRCKMCSPFPFSYPSLFWLVLNSCLNWWGSCFVPRCFSCVWLSVTPQRVGTGAHHGVLQARILGWGGHAFLQGIFLTHGRNPCLFCLLHWPMGSLPLARVGNPNR